MCIVQYVIKKCNLVNKTSNHLGSRLLVRAQNFALMQCLLTYNQKLTILDIAVICQKCYS